MQPTTAERSPSDTETNPSEEEVFVPYARAFLLDGQYFSATKRVRPWRGHMAECMGKALLLSEEMRNWEEWDDEDLLNMKKEVVIIRFTIFFNLFPISYIVI